MNTFNQDWVISQALAGLSMNGELARLRKAHEVGPRNARREYQELRAEACAAINTLKTIRESFIPETFYVDDLLGGAAVELKERAAEFHRKAQAEEAFRLRHGLPRAAEDR
ncbi:hypothetical protein [Candidatus Thiodiazotropha sp. LNASS1]|uniref:hypothetical protein n=1 Tax=Candidatus Thiodiazotropha sp. LNASS1 TaxID=3096260 RepID=UPI0034E0440D